MQPHSCTCTEGSRQEPTKHKKHRMIGSESDEMLLTTTLRWPARAIPSTQESSAFLSSKKRPWGTCFLLAWIFVGVAKDWTLRNRGRRTEKL